MLFSFLITDHFPDYFPDHFPDYFPDLGTDRFPDYLAATWVASLRGLRRLGGCVAPRRNDVERNKSAYSVASHGSVARCACAEGVRLGEREMHLRRSRQVPRRAKRGALRSKVARGRAGTLTIGVSEIPRGVLGRGGSTCENWGTSKNQATST